MSSQEYRSTIAYLFEQLPMYQREGSTAFKKDLTNTRSLCALLDHPEKKFRSVHVAGTNGKGSVSHMIAAPLQELGLSVGLYTSPHYRDFRERIKINGDYIPEKEVIEFVRSYATDFEEIKPSFFEITVAMAFWYFARKNVDLAIVETGLGGRLDSTNVLHPFLSVITNIGYDHMDMLGDTLPEIAREKAGIIKKNTSVIIGERQAEVEDVFVETAEQCGVDLSFAEDVCNVVCEDSTETHQILRFNCKHCCSKSEVRLEALGDYQIKNARTALAALCRLKSHEAMEELGIEQIQLAWRILRTKTGFMGRFQLIAHRPDVLVDSAHNAEGLREVLREISERDFDRLHLVVGLVREKDPEEILSLFPGDASYYFARADIPRGMDVERLAQAADTLGLSGYTFSSVPLALEAARQEAGEGDLIFVGGSTFTVAEVL